MFLYKKNSDMVIANVISEEEIILLNVQDGIFYGLKNFLFIWEYLSNWKTTTEIQKIIYDYHEKMNNYCTVESFCAEIFHILQKLVDYNLVLRKDKLD